MTIREFANLFDHPCSMEELLSRQEELAECDYIDDDILNGLLDSVQKENKLLVDRQVMTRAISTYIMTTGDFGYFIRGLLKELLIKDGCTKESIVQILKQADDQATRTRKRNYEKRIMERKKKEEEKQRKEAALKKLEESIDLSKTVVSYDTARFLIRNGITYEELEKRVSLDIYSQEDIDPVLHKYRLASDGVEEMISIADVVGYDYNYMVCGKDILKAFPNFFDSNKKDGYHTRSLSMLDLTTENAMSAFSHSFQEEPMKLADAPGGRYTINGNGMHRYSILRSLYLIEMSKANGNEEQEQAIREKYTVPALVSKIDYVKTYSNFILSSLKTVFWVGNERDELGNLTGRVKVEETSGEILFLTNEELLTYVRNTMIAQRDNPTVKWLLERNNPPFSHFLSLTVPELLVGYGKEEENAKVV